MKLTSETVERLLEKHGQYLDATAWDYGEPGYKKEHPDNCILFANWNGLPDHVMSAIEKQFDTEWSDEWINADETDKAYRTTGDCWSWTPFYWIDGCEVIGGDEIKEDFDLQKHYIETYLLNSYKHVDMFDLDLSKHGFHQVNGDFESGMYGREDSPKAELEKWQEKLPNYEFVFGNFSSGQFACEFNLYGREREVQNDGTDL